MEKKTGREQQELGNIHRKLGPIHRQSENILMSLSCLPPSLVFQDISMAVYSQISSPLLTEAAGASSDLVFPSIRSIFALASSLAPRASSVADANHTSLIPVPNPTSSPFLCE